MNNDTNGQPLSREAAREELREVEGWNWGAFSLTFFWSIGNRVYRGLLILLMFIPVIGQIFYIIWKLVMGFKGSKWAFEKGDYDSVEEFNKVQETWRRPGIVCFVFWLISIILGAFFWTRYGNEIYSYIEQYYNTYMPK